MKLVPPGTLGSPTPASGTLSAGSGSIEALRSNAARDPKGAAKEAAKQFEGLFMQQLMKSMRASTMSSGMLDNAGSQLGTEMLDTQFATQMTGLPGGLSDAIARQLARQMGDGSAPTVATPTVSMPAVKAAGVTASVADAAPTPAGAAGAPQSMAALTPSQQRQAEFLRAHQDAARSAEAQTGIPASFMVAQAAHETGWGRHQIRNADGSSANNLFGIKAGGDWKGAVATVTTTEYVNGEARKVVAKFRSYASSAESFRDYAQLMKDSPRYAGVVAQASQGGASAQGFAQGLQKAGYATDPAYADKLTRMINQTLQLQRSLA